MRARGSRCGQALSEIETAICTGALNRPLPQRRPVWYAQQGYARVFGRLEDAPLHVNTHSAGALIQQREFRPKKHTSQSTAQKHPNHWTRLRSRSDAFTFGRIRVLFEQSLLPLEANVWGGSRRPILKSFQSPLQAYSGTSHWKLSTKANTVSYKLLEYYSCGKIATTYACCCSTFARSTRSTSMCKLMAFYLVVQMAYVLLVEKPGHAHPLLLATRKHVFPFLFRVPSSERRVQKVK